MLFVQLSIVTETHFTPGSRKFLGLDLLLFMILLNSAWLALSYLSVSLNGLLKKNMLKVGTIQDSQLCRESCVKV